MAGQSRFVLEQTEILARLLTALPTQPALLWLGAAWPAYHTCSAGAYRSVLRYYDIPQLQMVEAFAPVRAAEAKWIQEMIASVVGFALSRGAEPAPRSWLAALEDRPPGWLPPPLFFVDVRHTQQRFFSLSLGYLVSHGGAMGVFDATLSCAGGMLANVKADGEDSGGTVSIYRTLVLRGDLNCPPNATLSLNVTVIPSAPPRGQNKVKLYDATVVII
ncbi:hypothetical protein M885DRAFT_576439 [Pelagophyceae sp. CCMP2097]|nr:hypothetical protein M885DRAFT_576439 [Pelagophyceae sp. CCMP2097]